MKVFLALKSKNNTQNTAKKGPFLIKNVGARSIWDGSR